MSEIEVPEGVGFASLAVVGNHARVLLRSDLRYHCAVCKLAPVLWTSTGPTVDAYWRDSLAAGASCEHIDAVRHLGVVRMLVDVAGREYPEFVWKRGGHSTVAPWPTSTDPDGAIAVLAEALRSTSSGLRGYHNGPDYYAAVAEAAIRGLRRKGYVVVPEWLSRVKPKDAALPTGRGARVIDFDDDQEPA